MLTPPFIRVAHHHPVLMYSYPTKQQPRKPLQIRPASATFVVVQYPFLCARISCAVALVTH